MGKYINQVTDEELTEFLENNGYSLVTNIKDQNGIPFPAIERSEKRAFVRCKMVKDPAQKQFDAEVARYLIKKHPGFLSLSMMLSGMYSSDIEMLIFSDYGVSKMCITDYDSYESNLLNENFVRFMYKKFENQNYYNNYNNHFDELETQDERDM